MMRCTPPFSRFVPALLAILAACGGVAVVTAADFVPIALALREGDAARPRQLAISGVWPDSCTPRFLKAGREGWDVMLHFHVPVKNCREQPAAFDVPVEVRTAFGGIDVPVGVYRVHVMAAHGDGPQRLIGFRLLDIGTRAVLPESGFWWSRASTPDSALLSGGGVGLEVQGGRLAASLLAFSADGTPTWYFGSASLQGRTAQIPLIRLLNGGGTASTDRPASVEGGPLLAIEFDTASSAQAWLVGAESGAAGAPLLVRRLPLRRAIFDPGTTGSSWTGSWVLVSGDESRVIDLPELQVGSSREFSLSGAAWPAPGPRLACRFHGAASSAEIDGCELRENGVMLARFGDIGVDRLMGESADGRPVQLLRIRR